MSPFIADLSLFCLGSLRFGTFGVVREFGFLFFFFFFFENLVWVCDFCVRICVCDFESKNKKSEIFVFVFGFLVATLFRLKNMIWGFCFWVSDLG